MIRLLLAVGLLAGACASGPCATPDLNDWYLGQVHQHCDVNAPLTDCPEHEAIWREYERAVTERLTVRACHSN